MRKVSVRFESISRERRERMRERQRSRIDYCEKSGIEHLKERVANAEFISREVASTLTLVVAATGGMSAVAVDLIRQERFHSALLYSVAAGVVYLTSLAIVLILKCMVLRPGPAIHNEPQNLYVEGASLDDIRLSELSNIQARIDEIYLRNRRMSRVLNAVRALVAVSPIVLLLGYVAAVRYLA